MCSSLINYPTQISNSCGSALLEKTHFSALKMCSHKWNVSYITLLSLFDIPFLSVHPSVRPSHSKFLYLFTLSTLLSTFSFLNLLLSIHSYNFFDSNHSFFSNTHANSFILSTSSLWNSLPLHIKSSSSFHSVRTKLLNFSPNVI